MSTRGEPLLTHLSKTLMKVDEKTVHTYGNDAMVLKGAGRARPHTEYKRS